MSLLTTLNDDIKTAMKAKDKETLAVLRMLKTAIQNDQIKAGRELNGEEELTVLSREMKQKKILYQSLKRRDATILLKSKS